MLQCVAACYSVLQRVAVAAMSRLPVKSVGSRIESALQCVVVCCSVLQCVAVAAMSRPPVK